ncbi:hypothetical protein BU23DRAFT_155405 [Bimuria novae-zelandiae CBS 107.79]|uniref:Uncharacterized protein n=1 Tax=Bimuria novae-zelandiae CBS 107.79 TaxID=1447943 RepID=A0A6A5VH68_9PLEO|nr:hypothetical protein BU23DRAFT_155405 [Bimuria novae-zelandiae CBS 107.79]
MQLGPWLTRNNVTHGFVGGIMVQLGLLCASILALASSFVRFKTSSRVDRRLVVYSGSFPLLLPLCSSFYGSPVPLRQDSLAFTRLSPLHLFFWCFTARQPCVDVIGVVP